MSKKNFYMKSTQNYDNIEKAALLKNEKSIF